jgi:hypothetical protein
LAKLNTSQAHISLSGLGASTDMGLLFVIASIAANLAVFPLIIFPKMCIDDLSSVDNNRRS